MNDTTIELGREYYSISDKMYQWLRSNAPDTAWDQMFGYTYLKFTSSEALGRFKEWLGKP